MLFCGVRRIRSRYFRRELSGEVVVQVRLSALFVPVSRRLLLSYV
jgi:hypothetical protein